LSGDGWRLALRESRELRSVSEEPWRVQAGFSMTTVFRTSMSIPLWVGRNFPTWFPMGRYFNVSVWTLRTCMLPEGNHQACNR